MLRSVAFICCAVGLAMPAAAGTIYVNNVIGDDVTNGHFADRKTHLDGPVATLARAVQLANPGDAIEIANTGTPYAESLLFARPDLSGSNLRPLIIEGNGATLRGLAPLDSDYWEYVGSGTYRYQPVRKGHYQLFVNGKPAEEVPAADGGKPPELQPLQWCVVRGHVHLRIEPSRFIDQYVIEVPALEVGIGLYDARHVTVRNLTVEGFRLDGVNVHGRSRQVTLEGIRSLSNGRAGLAMAATAQATVNGLEASGNRVADVLSTSRSRLELRQAKLLGGGRFGLLIEGGRVTAYGPEMGKHREADRRVVPGAELKIAPADAPRKPDAPQAQ